jgi:hypothetical protein
VQYIGGRDLGVEAVDVVGVDSAARRQERIRHPSGRAARANRPVPTSFCLRDGGIGGLVGMDLIPEAREAALRERPDAYREYVAGDVGEPGLVERLVSEHGLNALVCSGGISHIPVDAFAVGWDAFPPGSWLVATAREEMDQYAAGQEDVHTERFVHRLAFSGEPIEYIALRGRKPWR